MLTSKYTRVVAILIVVLELVSIVLTFVGAFMGGELGSGLLMTGVFGFVAFAIFGWILITVYNRVHRDEQEVNRMLTEAQAPAETDQNEEQTEKE